METSRRLLNGNDCLPLPMEKKASVTLPTSRQGNL